MGNQIAADAAAGGAATIVYPLTFHQTHSDVVKLSSNEAIAHRASGFCNGITFGSRPVTPREKIRLKLLDVADNWNGSLRFGFTSVNPATMVAAELPRYSCPDLTKLPGYWAIAIPDGQARRGNVLTFIINDNGTVTYQCDGRDMGRLICGLPTTADLWPIFDLYGNSMKAELLTEASNPNLSGADMAAALEDNIKLPHYGCLALESFCFNRQIKGGNIEITSDCRTVSHTKFLGNGNFVFSERPLPPGSMWVCMVVEVELRWGKKLSFGLTNANPSSLPKPLSSDIQQLKRTGDWHIKDELYMNPLIGDELAVGFRNDGKVQVALNGKEFVQLLTIPSKDPVWIFVDLGCTVRKIKSCGVHRLTGRSLPYLPGFAPLEMDVVQVIPPPPAATPPPVVDFDGEVGTCSICFDKNVNCVFYHCGHLCTCHECAQNLLNRPQPACPICRQPIDDVIKVFRS